MKIRAKECIFNKTSAMKRSVYFSLTVLIIALATILFIKNTGTSPLTIQTEVYPVESVAGKKINWGGSLHTEYIQAVNNHASNFFLNADPETIHDIVIKMTAQNEIYRKAKKNLAWIVQESEGTTYLKLVHYTRVESRC